MNWYFTGNGEDKRPESSHEDENIDEEAAPSVPGPEPEQHKEEEEEKEVIPRGTDDNSKILFKNIFLV